MKLKKKLISEIIIEPGRQREDLGDIAELHKSIRDRAGDKPFQEGLINPILLRGDILVAGERRLAAHTLEGVEWIWATDRSTLSPEEAELFELDENAKRKNLTWLEWTRTVQRIHALQHKLHADWTMNDTATYMGYAENNKQVNYAIALTDKLDDKLTAAGTLEAAYNALSRTQTRAFADLANELLASPKSLPLMPEAGKASSGSSAIPVQPVQIMQPILTESFLDWAPQWTGPKFNFIHCDFPYGIDIGESDQMKHETQELYADGKEVYWALLESLAENLDNFCFPSAHLMFWFSMEYYTETLEFLSTKTPFVMQKRPLVWHKTDGAGVMPDHRRRPRNTYEVALIGARDDRFIVEPVASSYGAPTASKKLHPSEKPEPMLKHFFRMFVNGETSILDPTCGGGSALRAADDMGAKRVLGLEINPEFSGAANGALRQSRAKRAAAAKAA